MEGDTSEGCAVVTGGTKGIGAAIADALEAAGWKVARVSRGGEGGFKADVGNPEDVERVFAEITEQLGPPLVLVNNAGIRRDQLAMRLDQEAWNDVININLNGAFNCISQALSPMLRQRWGRIVNVSSVVAQVANPGQANYAAAKAGLLGLTKTVAREMARKGITCNAVLPGLVVTDLTEDVADKLVSQIPAARAGKPEEIAACVAFLCSPEAAYVNGAALTIDGALTA
jgi:3-oxoacyl-[acyl-carrier protein] reductase